tara:strand:- start:1784 stop:2128 length:345 start_codon:yes stop_codon:yes gene_type:complete
MNFAAPKLSRLLTLETPITQPDGAGGYSNSWTVLGHLWAAVDVASGRATSGETSPITRVSYNIIVRASPDGSASRPRAGQRFREAQRLYQIKTVKQVDGRAHYLSCFATEELAL